MPDAPTLLYWHQRLRHWPVALRLVWMIRLLLAVGFIPTGLVKLLGERFSQISVDHPAGFFFEALYRTGSYWQFIGGMQVLAALLLLLPATALLGATIFLPLILNIFVITLSLAFAGTPVVTGLMLLATLYLLVWDAHRLAPLLHPQLNGWLVPDSRLPVGPAEGAAYALAFGFALILGFWTRGFSSGFSSWLSPLWCMALSALAGATGVGLYLRAEWRGRRSLA